MLFGNFNFPSLIIYLEDKTREIITIIIITIVIIIVY